MSHRIGDGAPRWALGARVPRLVPSGSHPEGRSIPSRSIASYSQAGRGPAVRPRPCAWPGADFVDIPRPGCESLESGCVVARRRRRNEHAGELAGRPPAGSGNLQPDVLPGALFSRKRAGEGGEGGRAAALGGACPARRPRKGHARRSCPGYLAARVPDPLPVEGRSRHHRKWHRGVAARDAVVVRAVHRAIRRRARSASPSARGSPTTTGSTNRNTPKRSCSESSCSRCSRAGGSTCASRRFSSSSPSCSTTSIRSSSVA